MTSDDKSRLVDYDPFSWREYDIYTTNSIVQENEPKSGCRRECGYKGQDPKSYF